MLASVLVVALVVMGGQVIALLIFIGGRPFKRFGRSDRFWRAYILVVLAVIAHLLWKLTPLAR